MVTWRSTVACSIAHCRTHQSLHLSRLSCSRFYSPSASSSLLLPCEPARRNDHDPTNGLVFFPHFWNESHGGFFYSFISFAPAWDVCFTVVGVRDNGTSKIPIAKSEIAILFIA